MEEEHSESCCKRCWNSFESNWISGTCCGQCIMAAAVVFCGWSPFK